MNKLSFNNKDSEFILPFKIKTILLLSLSHSHSLTHSLYSIICDEEEGGKIKQKINNKKNLKQKYYVTVIRKH